ncbi:MAG: hypothetical protein QG628_661 [Patescibacteria group bacterium]|nr:hypothetical protein [Patescibacteria group bacterium]
MCESGEKPITTSSYVSAILDEVSSDAYRDAMDYFGTEGQEPADQPPETAVEAARLRAANIQAGHVYGLTKKLV